MARKPPKSSASNGKQPAAAKPMHKRSRNSTATGADGPSRDTRFKPGQSGNPNGRPRKDRVLQKLIEAELDQEMTVTEGGKTIRLTKREALAKSMVNDALKGDHRARSTLLKQLPPPRHDDTADYAAVPLEQVLQFLMRKGGVGGKGEVGDE